MELTARPDVKQLIDAIRVAFAAGSPSNTITQIRVAGNDGVKSGPGTEYCYETADGGPISGRLRDRAERVAGEGKH